MTAVLDGFLPRRRRRDVSQPKDAHSRSDDPAISLPTHSETAAAQMAYARYTSSSELDRAGPITPPRSTGSADTVIISEHDDLDAGIQNDKASITITIPLPWKKRRAQCKKSSIGKGPVSTRQVNGNAVPRIFTHDMADFNFTANTFTSPVEGYASTKNAASPVSSFRSRIASPSLGSSLSPVAEGFARENIPSKATTVRLPLQLASTMSAMEQSVVDMSDGRPADSALTHTYTIMTNTTPSSTPPSCDIRREQSVRSSPQSGIGITGHMRASSREPTAGSRRSSSTERTVHHGPCFGGSNPENNAVLPAVTFTGNSYHDPNIAPTRKRDPSPAIDDAFARQRKVTIDLMSVGMDSTPLISCPRDPARDSRGRCNANTKTNRVPMPSDSAPLALNPYIPSLDHSRPSVSQDLFINDNEERSIKDNALENITTQSTYVESHRAHSQISAPTPPDRESEARNLPVEHSLNPHHELRPQSLKTQAQPRCFPAIPLQIITNLPRGAQTRSAGPSIHYLSRDQTFADLPPHSPRASSRPRTSHQRTSSSRNRGVYEDVKDDYRQLARDVSTATATTSRTSASGLSADTNHAPVLASTISKNRKSHKRVSSRAHTPIAIVKRWSDEYGAGEEHPALSSSPSSSPSLAVDVNGVTGNKIGPSMDRHQCHRSGGSGAGLGLLVLRRRSHGYGDCDGDDESDGEGGRGRSRMKGEKKKLVPSGNELWS